MQAAHLSPKSPYRGGAQDTKQKSAEVELSDLAVAAAAERCATAAGLRLSPTEKEHLAALLARMTVKQRRLAELTIAGYTTAEIAAKLGVTSNAVHKMRARMRRRTG